MAIHWPSNESLPHTVAICYVTSYNTVEVCWSKRSNPCWGWKCSPPVAAQPYRWEYMSAMYGRSMLEFKTYSDSWLTGHHYLWIITCDTVLKAMQGFHNDSQESISAALAHPSGISSWNQLTVNPTSNRSNRQGVTHRRITRGKDMLKGLQAAWIPWDWFLH